ncbi:MAG: prepilin-type N-terminal cleavage/methylation domain-containing protein, partial [Proteobacteria bacterium]|nr:prepilin-type N-terminal cleavage/methylation domain-containing protein [Pseudomonadota bacterium]
MRRAFTLLEVLIALGILAVSLVVLVDAQATAVFMTRETDRIFTATLLAQEKMAEVKLYVETEGFVDKDLEEQGTFEDYEIEALELDFEDAFDEFEWAYTIREVELSLGGDIGGMADSLGQTGYFGDDGETTGTSEATEDRGLEDLGVQPDMITEMLSP